MDKDLNQLKNQIGTILTDELRDLLEGAQGDLVMFTEAVSKNIVEAAMIEDEARRNALLTELKGQILTLGEINRLRAVNSAWNVVSTVISVASRTAIAALVAI